jgi:YHS domain-containing protein
MIKTIILAVAAIAVGGALAGCGSDTTTTTTTEKTDSLDVDNMTPVVFANDKGEALCPVMGGAMADTTNLKYEDYDGKRYYFCCDECPAKFHADPAKYADDKVMPKDGGMEMPKDGGTGM